MPESFRSWTYINLTTVFTPEWSFIVMPGYKYEFYQNSGDPGKTVLYELFIGPAYNIKAGNFAFILPLYYYYLGAPVRSTGKYYYTHNIAFVPLAVYTMGRWEFRSRLFCHNTFYANYYETEELRRGYALLVAPMLMVTFRLIENFSLSVSDEVPIVFVEDIQATPTTGAGFLRKGLYKNRLYSGVIYSFDNSLSLKLQYVYETTYGTDRGLDRVDHTVFTVVSYVLKL